MSDVALASARLSRDQEKSMNDELAAELVQRMETEVGVVVTYVSRHH